MRTIQIGSGVLQLKSLCDSQPGIMNRPIPKILLVLICLSSALIVYSQQNKTADDAGYIFRNPPASARPWVFWYWMHAAVSREGITADLEAMKQVGIGGAYLMPLKDTNSSIPFKPVARQLTPEWWALVKHAMQESKRLGLQLAMHVSDGFALAGGPWITPDLSMQKLVWTKTYVKGGDAKAITLPQPKAKENYYKDVAVFAYPANCTNAFLDSQPVAAVTTSNGTRADFLAVPQEKESFRSDTTCWIQYTYPQPFTCRSITIHVSGNNYQAQRLLIQTSDDGVNFKTVTRLQPPRHGWQDTDEDYTHALPAITSRWFRFIYNKEDAEPGSEDLDAAKWKPSFKVAGIYLSDEPVINQYEAKNGSIWRVAVNTTNQQVTAGDAVPLHRIVDLTGNMDGNGRLKWTAPAGNWIIVRIGHTSNGHTNYTGGAGLGLECDKFNATAVKLQFNSWFAEAFEKTDPVLAKEVLKVLHVDSWECGSQNWSTGFPAEFRKRRGYALGPYLLTMAGVPVKSAVVSEKVLHDVRQTIAELVNDVFYVTLNNLAKEKGCRFSAEAIAPTMTSDGMQHYKHVDLPMGEFWLNSPTHDKPNDMLDAISGAHIYGKNIVAAESFTSVRMNWNEHPGNMKVVGDRNFALGINKMVIHVFTQNPWLNKKPGMTLDGVGLYYQRDQTWFKQSKAWIDYLTRCSALLQMGKPVVDIAVFTGEEVPRRAVLPERLVNTLPGIFGKEKLDAEAKRLANTGQPLRTIPDGVPHSANMADPEDWIDPLNGYAYDSFNPDALMKMSVKNGKVVLPGGASYSILVFPSGHSLQPNSALMSLPVAQKILQLVKDGAKVVFKDDHRFAIGMNDGDNNLKRVITELFSKSDRKGEVIVAPLHHPSFTMYGLEKDIDFITGKNCIAWTHRKAGNADIYFLANQTDSSQLIKLLFRVSGKMPEVWDPVTNAIAESANWRMENGKTFVTERLEPNQSVFIIFRKPALKFNRPAFGIAQEPVEHRMKDYWKVQFDTAYASKDGDQFELLPGSAVGYNGGPSLTVYLPPEKLKGWSQFDDPAVKYYSGTAVYSNVFDYREGQFKKAWLEFDSVFNIASVEVNGIDCGTIWTYPWKSDITHALKPGKNIVTITVSNTWHNRLIGDQPKPVNRRVTWTTAPFRLNNKPLLPAGITGSIKLMTL